MSDDKKVPIGEEQWVIADKEAPAEKVVTPQPGAEAPAEKVVTPQPGAEAPAEKVVTPQPGAEAPAVPPSTGDMQKVGATEPAEVPERREVVDGEPPVEEDPGDQNSG